MLTLSAKIRKEIGKKTKTLRKKGILPGVLYGPRLKKTQPLELSEKEFEKVYKEVGESTLTSLEVDDKKKLVLIQEVKLDPLTGKPIHVDFYQPNLEEEIEVKVPLIFEGEAPAVKELGGTLIKIIHELEVKAKPEDLPKEIKVDVSSLKTFEDVLKIRNLLVPTRVRILKNPEEIVAEVSPPERVEELEKVEGTTTHSSSEGSK